MAVAIAARDCGLCFQQLLPVSSAPRAKRQHFFNVGVGERCHVVQPHLCEALQYGFADAFFGKQRGLLFCGEGH